MRLHVKKKKTHIKKHTAALLWPAKCITLHILSIHIYRKVKQEIVTFTGKWLVSVTSEI